MSKSLTGPDGLKQLLTDPNAEPLSPVRPPIDELRRSSVSAGGSRLSKKGRNLVASAKEPTASSDPYSVFTATRILRDQLLQVNHTISTIAADVAGPTGPEPRSPFMAAASAEHAIISLKGIMTQVLNNTVLCF